MPFLFTLVILFRLAFLRSLAKATDHIDLIVLSKHLQDQDTIAEHVVLHLLARPSK